MEDFIARELNNRRSYGALTWAVNMVKNWKSRREMRKLWAMSDYQLADIGLTRASLGDELRRPLTSNWDFERARQARLEAYDTKMEECSLPLSSLEGGQTHLPETMWLLSEEYRAWVLEATSGMKERTAKPIAAPIMTYSTAVAADSSFRNAFTS